MANRIVVENGTPKIVLDEQSRLRGGVSVDDAIILAKQLSRRIIEEKKKCKFASYGYFAEEVKKYK